MQKLMAALAFAVGVSTAALAHQAPAPAASPEALRTVPTGIVALSQMHRLR